MDASKDSGFEVVATGQRVGGGGGRLELLYDFMRSLLCYRDRGDCCRDRPGGHTCGSETS
jgi:hypothetical protein